MKKTLQEEFERMKQLAGINEVKFSSIYDLNKDQFLGKPKITTNANAKFLYPSELSTLENVKLEPFMNGKYSIKMNEDGAVVFDGEKIIASYNFGDTLVVDKKYRGLGIAKELVYKWRKKFPNEAVANTRTKASQAIQKKVWDRLQREKDRLEWENLSKNID